ncbi:hypothetical protein CU254_02300 [Amycolatopsis sp. AA4]|uniref:hypothetical protein n=1 Tax=Actinomycetes TaxID=1760 RepID=UPI0001B58A7A|nr:MULTISPECIES: hypothetical protein [Actinomycetes]ATY09439.1 hypothetical protein CU254_02300 [Amycolatopsis sp. AA4]
MANLTPQEIVRLVKSGKGSGGMFHGSDQSAALSAQHEDIANEMRQLQSAMDAYWKGDAAGRAYVGAGPLVQASQTSGQHLAQAQALYSGQGGSFDGLRDKIAAVGDLGDKPADDWVSDTPLSFMSNRASEIEEWEKKAQEVVNSYQSYHGESTENSARWADPSQYGQLALPSAGGDFTITQPGGTGTAHLPTHYTPGGTGGTAGTYSEGGYVGGNTGNTSNTASTGDTSGSSGHRDHTNDRTGPPGTLPPSETHRWDPERYTPPPGNPPESGRHVPPPANLPDDTRTSGYVPPDLTSTGSPNSTSWSVNSSNPSTGNSNGGSSFYPTGLPGTGGGSAGSIGGPGSGNGGNAGSNVGRGAGIGSGPNAEVTARGGAAAGANGRAGAPGGMGAGAMGRGQKGEGEDDLVHETADYLVEQDPDAALIGDLPKAVPPVIGL